MICIDKTTNFKTALGIALKMLVKHDKTAKQIEDKLKDFEDETVENVILWLKKRNYVNDLRFAESYYRSRKRKRWGGFKIKHHLEELGVTEEIIEKAAGDIDLYEKDTALTLLKKRDNDDRNKQVRFLLSRGFKYETVINAVETVKQSRLKVKH